VFVLVLVGVLLLASNSQASHSNITSDGTLGTRVTFDGKNFYDINGGRIRGRNLFHSFWHFILGDGETASFNGPSGIRNIITRVTGGEQSFIDGLLRSTIDGANLFFINPAGVMFGANARLNVSGSFHVSTADYLSFAGGAKFFADPDRPLRLTAAPPAAFGFLGPNVAGISIDGSILTVPQGKTLSVVGGDIQMVGGRLEARSGRIHIAGVASAGEVPLSGDFNVGSFARMGQINLSNGAFIEVSGTSGNPGGTVLIRGGRLIANNSRIFADTVGNVNGASVGIDLQAADDIILANGTIIRTQKLGVGETRAGDISVSARNLTIMTNSNIRSTAGFAGAQSGDVTVRATDSVNISGNGSGIFTASVQAPEDTGNISVEARNVTLTNRAEIRSGSDFEQGGNVTVTAKESIVISGRGGISSQAFNTKVREVAISAANLVMDDGFIRASTRGDGDAGNISVNARNVSLTRGSRIATSSELALTKGKGGNLTINADSVSISGGSGLFSTAEGRGSGGSITVQAGQVQLNNGTISARSTSTQATANAGNIFINADVFRSRNSQVTTEANQAGGGTIQMKATRLVHLTDSKMTTSVRGGDENAGNIFIDPQFVILNRSQIRADAFGGDGGNVNIRANVFLNSRSEITASSERGVPGTIDIQASITDLSGTLAQLPEDVLQASELLRASCAVRLAGGKASSLVVGGRDGLPPEPGGLVPSPLYLEGQAGPSSSTTGLHLRDKTSEGAGLLGAKGFTLAQGWNQPRFSLLSPKVGCAP
jgi:filamentous hemagglutinin family protein